MWSFFVEQPDLSSDNMFLAFIEAIRHTIPHAMRDAMTCEPSQIMMGMSAETFWGGLEGNAEFTARLRDVCGDAIGICTGANALDESLKAFRLSDDPSLSTSCFFSESSSNSDF